MACGLIYREHLRTARGPLPRLQPRPAGGGEDGRADTARLGHSAPARRRPLRRPRSARARGRDVLLAAIPW